MDGISESERWVAERGTDPRGEWVPNYAERLHLIEDLERTAAPPSEEHEARRAAWDSPYGEPEPTAAEVEDVLLPGPHGDIPVRIYRPAGGAAGAPGLVWIHGGAFIMGDLDMPEADLVAKGLVTRTGAVVVSVYYRLCQDGIHFPVPDDDCWAAWMWTNEHAGELGIDPARIAVGGASAGGKLAASVGLRGRDEGPEPWQVLLAYPVAHAVVPQPSERLGSALAITPPLLTFPEADMLWINENYLGGPIESATPAAFPALSDDLSGYPPTFIENSEFDSLLPSGERFAEQLAEAGVDVELVTAAGVSHGHLNAVGSPATHASLDRFAARLKRP